METLWPFKEQWIMGRSTCLSTGTTALMQSRTWRAMSMKISLFARKYLAAVLVC